MTRRGYIAFDLGAESGRAMLAVLDGDRLALAEHHRFANTPQHLPSGYHWNLVELWRHLIEGLRKCGQAARAEGVELVSVGVDTWGVDMALVGRSGQVLTFPYVYRDSRHLPAMRRTIEKLGENAIYNATGIQLMPVNTLYQLLAQYEDEPDVVRHAQRMLSIADLFHYFLSGQQVNELTIASTTQMLDLHRRAWATELIDAFGLPTHLFGPLVPAATRIGRLRDQVAKDAEIEPLDVIVPGSHDTASAVAAVPVDPSSNRNWAYVSSGTWSLLGVELTKAVVNDKARVAGFTNERGVQDTIRFLKNIAGLWLVQEVRSDLGRCGQEHDYAQLTTLAAKAEPFTTLIDPNHEPFAQPGDILTKIDDFARATGQARPETTGQVVRSCLESLALYYRQTLLQMERVLGRTIDVLHIVGGGGKNTLLNQFIADAIGRPVHVGPYEATAIGNALTQAMGSGHVKDLEHLRRIVRGSSDLDTYEPINVDAFDKKYEQFRDVIGAPN